jgi:hypothetical protein
MLPIGNLQLACADLRMAQELAGHSTTLLTARYSHRRLHELPGAVREVATLGVTAIDRESNTLSCFTRLAPRGRHRGETSGETSSNFLLGKG